MHTVTFFSPPCNNNIISPHSNFFSFFCINELKAKSRRESHGKSHCFEEKGKRMWPCHVQNVRARAAAARIRITALLFALRTIGAASGPCAGWSPTECPARRVQSVTAFSILTPSGMYLFFVLVHVATLPRALSCAGS